MNARAAALLLTLFATPCLAGVVFEYETVDRTRPGQAPDTIHTEVDGKRIKIDVKGPRGADADMIYRGDRQEMLAINHEEQSYILIDEATIGEISQRLSALEAQMQEALKDVPADQRAMMEEMMRQRMPQAGAAAPSIEVRKAGEKGDQNGYPSERFELYRDGELTKTVWVTDWNNVDGSQEAAAAFESMGEFIAKIQDAMPDFAKSSSVGSNAYEHLEELGGFPVVTLDHDGNGSVTAETRLISSKEESVDSASFEAPASYQRMQMMR